ncbi:MAG: tetratricopeptide repeat protein [Candidatus Lindowbacteria bacterium]|nr:tetratricopeptide repeat protein [Candidatus Lindowbacteria bacterium]
MASDKKSQGGDSKNPGKKGKKRGKQQTATTRSQKAAAGSEKLAQKAQSSRPAQENFSSTKTRSAINKSWVNDLSVKTYVITFAATFGFVCFMLWGLYVPYLRSEASNSVGKGDAYLARAVALRDQGFEKIEISEMIDEKVNRVYPIVRIFEESGQYATGTPKDVALKRQLRTLIQRHEKSIREFDDLSEQLVTEAGVREDFVPLMERINTRANTASAHLDAVVGKDWDEQTQEEYVLLCNIDVPFLIRDLKRVRDLFDVESCFDRGMQEYIEAIALARLWPIPRFHLAELYKARGWSEFAMMEFLRVMKLDSDGEFAEKAFNQIVSFEGKHAEAEFNIGLAYLMKGDYANGEEYLKRFLEKAPTNIYGPKAFELIEHLEENDHRFVRRYLRDEIWT